MVICLTHVQWALATHLAAIEDLYLVVPFTTLMQHTFWEHRRVVRGELKNTHLNRMNMCLYVAKSIAMHVAYDLERIDMEDIVQHYSSQAGNLNVLFYAMAKYDEVWRRAATVLQLLDILVTKVMPKDPTTYTENFTALVHLLKTGIDMFAHEPDVVSCLKWRIDAYGQGTVQLHEHIRAMTDHKLAAYIVNNLACDTARMEGVLRRAVPVSTHRICLASTNDSEEAEIRRAIELSIKDAAADMEMARIQANASCSAREAPKYDDYDDFVDEYEYEYVDDDDDE